MSEMHYCGSIYKQVKHPTADLKDYIEIASMLDCHYMFTVGGKHYLATGNKLYIWVGKEKGFKSPWSKMR